MKKQPEITAATREAFIKVFCDFYMQRPIERITVKEISEKAGYSRVTFYNYFKDPYDLLEYIEEDFISYITKEIAANIKEDRKLNNFILNFIRVISGKELYSKVLLSNPNNSQFANRLKKKTLPIFMEVFGFNENDKKALYTFEFYISGIISLISKWIQNDKDVPIEQMAQLVENILKRGVLAQLL